MKKIVLGTLLVVLLGMGIFFAGPKPSPPNYLKDLPVLATPLTTLDDSLELYEEHAGALPCAYAEIVWKDSIRKTPLSLLYLHGFSATKHEGDTLIGSLANEYGMNVFYNRMAGHGLKELDAERMKTFTAERAWNKVLYDFKLARKLGNKVLIVSCSTGSPLALRLAALYPESIAGVVNYSPNMGLPDPSTRLLNGPWGLELVQAISGQPYRKLESPSTPELLCKPHAYAWESVVQMQHLVETILTDKLLEQIKTPVLNVVWYENDSLQDNVIDVSMAKTMHDKLGSPSKHWVETAARNHVLHHYQRSEDLSTVVQHTRLFIEDLSQ